MTFLKPVPHLAKCECEDPHCLGYFVDNIELREGRFTKADGLLVLHRHNLAAALKEFMGYMVRKGTDSEDKDLFRDLVKLSSEIRP